MSTFKVWNNNGAGFWSCDRTFLTRKEAQDALNQVAPNDGGYEIREFVEPVKYRLWVTSKVDPGIGSWSDWYPNVYTDRAEAEKVCAEANKRAHLSKYEVARVDANGGKSALDVHEDTDLSEDSNAYSDEDLDTPIPFTLPSQVRVFTNGVATDYDYPDSEPAPEGKRFVDIEDLRSAANAVTVHSHEWRVGVNRVQVAGPMGDAVISLNGCRLSPTEARALMNALEGALKAVA